MNEPERLRDGEGPAAMLLRGSGLEVPSAARRRALTFASTLATGVAATSTAGAAAATSLGKSFMIYLAFGAMGGGALSLAASSAISWLEPPAAPSAAAKVAPAPAKPIAPVPPAAVPAVTAEPSPVDPPSEASEHSDQAGPTNDAPRPSSSEARASVPAASLFEEQRAIERARAAISRGDAGSGLAQLDAYERGYERRQFGPEALALRVEALRLQGQLGAARSRANDFEQRYPRHPLLARVRELAR